jgi:paraquat-inducible protein B|tara:strand:+ start:22838 stop:24433 length:1596 start_codon:yes stop_codon:yes gene_type:complete
MNNNEQPLSATVSTIKGFNPIWLIPLLALFIGAWMLFYTWMQQGPEIQISFESASGIEEGKTKIKVRSLDIGTVTEIHFNDDFDGVIVTAQMLPGAVPFLVKDSAFWVVEPRIDSSGVSGLSTLLSGAYIELAPSNETDRERVFAGLAKPPQTPPDAPGLHITLNSGGRFDFSPGNKIIYKGLDVGQIEDVHFNSSERIVYYNVFVKAPYHELLTENTKFWSISGISVGITSDGLKVKTGTLGTILSGGIEFGVPEDTPLGDKITERSYFKIYSDYEAIFKQNQEHKIAIEYMLLFKESISGLNRKAAVKFRGLTIGEVAEVNVPYQQAKNVLDKNVAIPVRILLYPQAMGLADDNEAKAQVIADVEKWITKGLSASIEIDSILGGTKLVELSYSEDQQQTGVKQFQSHTVIPVAPNAFGKILQNASTLMLQATATLKRFDQVALSADKFVINTTEANLPKAIKTTLNQIDVLAGDLAQGSPLQQELMQTFTALNRVLYELEPLLKQVSEQPNSLIFDRTLKADEQPRAAQ